MYKHSGASSPIPHSVRGHCVRCSAALWLDLTCRSGFQSESGLHLSFGPNPFFRAIDGALTVRTQRSPYPLKSLGAIGPVAACALFFILFPPFIPPTYLRAGLDITSSSSSNLITLFHKALGQPAATCSVLNDDYSSSPPLPPPPGCETRLYLDDHHHTLLPLVQHTHDDPRAVRFDLTLLLFYYYYYVLYSSSAVRCRLLPLVASPDLVHPTLRVYVGHSSRPEHIPLTRIEPTLPLRGACHYYVFTGWRYGGPPKTRDFYAEHRSSASTAT